MKTNNPRRISRHYKVPTLVACAILAGCCHTMGALSDYGDEIEDLFPNIFGIALASVVHVIWIGGAVVVDVITLGGWDCGDSYSSISSQMRDENIIMVPLAHNAINFVEVDGMRLQQEIIFTETLGRVNASRLASCHRGEQHMAIYSVPAGANFAEFRSQHGAIEAEVYLF